jgi:serine-type D-Ala-D-Ala carboxypeptidase
MLQKLIDDGLSRGLYLGASFRIFTRAGTVLSEGWTGRAQETPELPADADTIWDLASLTKPVATATSILMLAEQGTLHLDEDAAHFLPGEHPSLQGITLRHCLTHTSGLKWWEQLHSKGWTPQEIVAKVRASERQRPVGTGYTYSDLNYLLLGDVIRSVTGVSVADFARERIFQPLGMRDTGYLPAENARSRIAATWCPDRNRVLVGEVHDGNCDALGGVAGHAGLFGTLGDLERYGRMLLNEGELSQTSLLAPLTVRQMGTNQNPPGLNGHTLGWFTRPSGFFPGGDFLPPDSFGHTGFTGTSLVLSPSIGVGVALLTNRVYCRRDATDFLKLRKRFHNAVAGTLRV